MALKTAYKNKSPNVEITGAPADVVAITRHDDGSADVRVNEELQRHQQADESAQRLKQQLQQLETSEKLQYQHQAQQRQAQAEQQVAAFWKQSGIPDSQLSLVRRRPGALLNLTNAAANAAAQQHQPGSVEHQQTAWRLFSDHLSRLEAEALNNVRPDLVPTPQASSPQERPSPAPSPQSQQRPTMSTESPFNFTSRVLPSEPSEMDRSSIVSAAVSRGPIGGGSYGSADPRRVTLTPEQVEHCRLAGVSEVQYAKGLLRLRKELADGERQR